MPTPIPIIVAICTPKSGTSRTLAISQTPPSATPRPNPAMTRGSPAASAEPNATIRIRSAASSPTDSEPASLCSTLSTGYPPSSIRSPPPSASPARSNTRSTDSAGTR